MTAMMVFFHCGSNTGYAIGRLERVFLDAARQITGRDRDVHFAYPDLSRGHPAVLPPDFDRVIRFDAMSRDASHLATVEQYVRERGITIALGFDQPPGRSAYEALRRGGVRTFVSYW